MTAVSAWWLRLEGSNLAQGDFLPRCLIPFFEPDYGTGCEVQDVPVKEYDCIVVTQSCDLENNKASLVALCPIYSISTFEDVNPKFREKGAWERVRQGRVEGLHLLASHHNPSDNRDSFVADCREIYSLPIGYLKQHAEGLGGRWRLHSPFLEHFSRAFARFFMRVGLPSSIPPFK
jgi:hypothetical protein